jgi:hypothetical protein
MFALLAGSFSLALPERVISEEEGAYAQASWVDSGDQRLLSRERSRHDQGLAVPNPRV